MLFRSQISIESPFNPTSHPASQWLASSANASNLHCAGELMGMKGHDPALDLGLHRLQVSYSLELKDDGRTVGKPPDENVAVLMNVDAIEIEGDDELPAEGTDTPLGRISSTSGLTTKGGFGSPGAQTVGRMAGKCDGQSSLDTDQC